MKVAIIGTVGIPANYGGYETLVENLLTFKQRPDIEYTVYCSSKAYDKKTKNYKGAKLKYIPLNANGAQAPIYDTISLIHALATSDVILSLGTVGSFILPLVRLFSKKKIIFNLDGIDDKREKFNSFSQRVLSIARKLAAKYGTVRISDNQGIKDYVSRVYKRDSVLIEYGGDQVECVRNDKDLKEKYNLKPFQYSFKVARIEPENNIEMILKAFSEMPEEQIVIVGNWDNSEFGRNLRQSYSTYPNILLLDSIYDPKELNLLRSSCKVYVHGHSAGGTNPSLVEAMNLGLPITAFDVKYNRETTENKTLYFNNTDSLKSKIKELSLKSELRNKISKDMKEIGERRYSWSRIVSLYEDLF